MRAAVLLVLLLVGCAHAEPSIVQVFQQVSRIYNPETQKWSSTLSVFVQGASGDGNRVFDRIHLINDAEELYFTLAKGQWSELEKPGEFWMGSNGLSFQGDVPAGVWRVILVTRSGQKVETQFTIAPQPPGSSAARTNRVTVKPAKTAGTYAVSGWVENYLVWPRDERGALLARTKTVGPVFKLPPEARSFELYSYDKSRAEGLLAGPFPVQADSQSADR